MTTPHFKFYGTKPEYRTLFSFGAIGSFRRVRDGNHDRTQFESQGRLGIALDRSEYTNGMVSYNPVLDSFCTSADYLLDKGSNIGDVFPSIRYDGGLVTSVLSNKDNKPVKFDIDERVFIQCQELYDILEGTIVTPPTSKSNFYTVWMTDGEQMNVKTKDIYTEHTVPVSGKPSVSLGFFAPKWLKQDQKVALLHCDVY